ncbi:Variant surface glycoprotein [Trypanosoma congolense IL3000]|uniref:Variant surface glycoprotein n=1 Tax=Trypanosoma congolense (strain IL3000) TaxID=1068625 RepID=F9W545_TRYCI|nr:Variant surface glycoprotein [Trypanosoma congolense IL3000]
MMTLKTVQVMLMVGFMVTGVKPDDEVVLNTSHFYLLCNLTKATTELWNTVAETEYFSDQEKAKLSKIIHEIFFGPNRPGLGSGMWELPDKFAQEIPKRNEFCISNSDSSLMPSPEESLASTFICLCTGIEGNGKNLCGLEVNGKDEWPDGDPVHDANTVFKNVWGDYQNGGVIKLCGDTSSFGEEQAIQNLKANITNIEKTLKVSSQDKKCILKDGEPCTKVKKSTTWLKLLTSIKLPPKLAQETIAEISVVKHTSELEPDSSHATGAESAPSPGPGPQTEPEPLSPKTPVVIHKQEARKAHPQQPEPEPEKAKNAPQKQTEKTEDPLPAPELNETSGSYLTSPKWPLWAALLI